VLKQDPKTLLYQKEAAKTYQQWAFQPNKEIHFLTAVRGKKSPDEPGQQLVWGWRGIAARTQASKDYRDAHYQARYNAALCQYELAQHLKKPDNRQKFLQRAKKELVYTHITFPELGGQKWFTKYNTLLKKVQRALDEPAVGLAASGR
jgi:hypothetical protein